MKQIKSVVKIVRLKANTEMEKAVERAVNWAMAEIVKVGGTYDSTHIAAIHTQEAPRILVMLTYFTAED